MKFTSFALKKELINALNGLGYIDATKVQDVVIPKALKNEKSVINTSLNEKALSGERAFRMIFLL